MRIIYAFNTLQRTLLSYYCCVCSPFSPNDFAWHCWSYRSAALTSCFADFKTFAFTFTLLLKNNFTVHEILRACLHFENLCPGFSRIRSSLCGCCLVCCHMSVTIFCFQDFLPVLTWVWHIWLRLSLSLYYWDVVTILDQKANVFLKLGRGRGGGGFC